jgi:hypothetical protein
MSTTAALESFLKPAPMVETVVFPVSRLAIRIRKIYNRWRKPGSAIISDVTLYGAKLKLLERDII